MATRNFQIELLQNGISTTGPALAYVWKRAKRYLHFATRMRGCTAYLEVDYISSYNGNFSLLFRTPSGVLADTLTLTKTTGVSADQAKRVRSSTLMSLSEDGTYGLEFGALASDSVIVFNARLIVAQPNPSTTEEHKSMLFTNNASDGDGAGIAGVDIYRTASTVFAPAMNLTAGSYDEGGSDKYVFPWFKFTASEWPNLSYCQLETMSDGFAASCDAALYYCDPVTGTQTEVSGSAFTHTITGEFVAELGPTFSMAGQPDGYYTVRFLSSSGASNCFWAGAWLHLVSVTNSDTASGRSYFRVGDGESKGRRKNKPDTFDANPTFETCTIKHPSLGTTYALAGTADQGLGSQLTSTNINVQDAYIKGVFRSASFSPTAGDRYDGDNNAGNGIESWLGLGYSVAIDCPILFDAPAIETTVGLVTTCTTTTELVTTCEASSAEVD